MVGVAEDITEAQRQLEEIRLAEAALRSSEERWRSVFENSAIGIVLADPSGRFVEANRAFQELVGYTNQELKTLTYVDITHEADICSRRGGHRSSCCPEPSVRCRSKSGIATRMDDSSGSGRRAR